MTKLNKALVGMLAIIMVVSFMPSPAARADQVSDLLAMIQQLQAQLTALQGQGTQNTGTGYQFTKNLTLGSKGTDVVELQKILIAGGYLKIAAPTGNFLSMTKAAVVAWQKAVGITPTSGYVGPLSRAKLNGMGGVGGGGVVPTTAFLNVMAAGPAAGTIPSGSIFNPVLGIKLSAGSQAVTVTGITVARGGFVANNKVTGVSIFDDGGQQYGNIVTSLTSDGKAIFSFGSTTLTVAAGQTKTIWVKADIDLSVTNGTISFAVTGTS